MDASALDGLLADLHASAPGGLEVRRDGACTLLQAAPADLPVVMRLLREQAGLNYLANLTAVDRGESFEVVYHLFRIPADGAQVVVKCRVPRAEPRLPSVVALYPTADWQEREVYDLMGVIFDGHPNLVRVLLPDDFVGHPLRKDFKVTAT